MSNFEINDAPEWQMDDAYGSLTDARWLRSEARVKALAADLAEMLKGKATDEILTRALSAYEEALMLQSSMQAFAKCLGAKDVTDDASLWQESRSAANFLINTMVRMEFELAFLEERRCGVVPAERCCSLMTEAWKRWYGDDVTPDPWLWAHKLHYYKTDQFIYNYPYTVGYLMSQALMHEWKVRGDAFYDFYTAMLRDTGRMTVDEIIRVHFGADAADPAFWEGAMQSVKQSSDDFGKLFKSTLNNRFHNNLACVINKSSRGAKLQRAFEELPLLDLLSSTTIKTNPGNQLKLPPHRIRG